MVDIDVMKKFLDKNNVIGVIGVTQQREKWGYKMYRELHDAGFQVYPLNPKYGDIDGDTCFSDLRALIDFLQRKPDVVITIVPPQVTEEIVRQCKFFGIDKVWMQPGSESEQAVRFCKENNLLVVYGACIVVDALKKL